MKKLAVLTMGLCMVFAFSSCGTSKQSAYKKAYEKAKKEERGNTNAAVADSQVKEVTAVVAAPTKAVETSAAGVRQEKVTVVSGADNLLNNFSIVAGSFGVKANAEGLKSYLDNQGYNSVIAFNPDKAMYRVIVATYSTRDEAENAKQAFKAKYPNRKDFQGAWLLYRLK